MYATDPKRRGMAQVLGSDERLERRTFPKLQCFCGPVQPPLALGHVGIPGHSPGSLVCPSRGREVPGSWARTLVNVGGYLHRCWTFLCYNT